MSAKKSFDVGPKRRVRVEEEKPTPKKRKRTKSKHPVLSTRNQKRKLRDRKRDAFFNKTMLIIVAVLLLAGAVVYILWLPQIRITHVEASGFPSEDTVASIAREELKGTYHGIFPRDSFFFYPERAIRKAVLEEYPAISAVSVSRTGFDSISLEGDPRAAAFWWCGTPDALAATDVSCYQADAEGLVFARADTVASSTGGMVRVYANLDTASSTGSYPLRAHVDGSESIPEILRFVRSVGTLGVPVASIAIRGDEADLFVAPSTRITYVVGHEKAATESAKAAFPKLNLEDGSLVYVDLRFDGKIYLKRVGEE